MIGDHSRYSHNSQLHVQQAIEIIGNDDINNNNVNYHGNQYSGFCDLRQGSNDPSVVYNNNHNNNNNNYEHSHSSIIWVLQVQTLS